MAIQDAETTSDTWAPVALTVVLWAFLHTTLIALGVTHFAAGDLVGPDSAMRVVRILDLVETGAWYDHSIARMNPPGGAELHWTRPFDVFLLLGAGLLVPFLGLKDALVMFAGAHAPFLHLIAAFVIAAAAEPLVGRERSYFASLAFLIQPAVLTYSMAGRADHHAAQFLLFAVLVMLVIRLIAEPTKPARALLTGAVAGLSIWLSVESVLVVGVSAAILAFAWLRDGGGWQGVNWRFAAGLAAVLALALVLERPPAALLDAEYDKVSAVHALIALLYLAFWTAVAAVSSGGNRFAGLFGRAGAGAAGALAMLAIVFAVYPRFFAGPMAEVDPRLFTIWMDNVGELRPLVPTGWEELGRFFFFLGPALVCIPFVVRRVVATRDVTAAQNLWIYALVLLAAFFPLALKHLRFAPFAEIVLALVLAGVLAHARRWWRWVPDEVLRALASATTTVVLLFGFAGGGSAVMASAGDADERDRSRKICETSEVVEFLGFEGGYGAESRTIVSLIDYGSALLLGTPHKVLAAPYHRNREGILDAYHILATVDPEASRSLIAERGVQLILICPSPREARYYDADDPGQSIYERLVAGEAPPWLLPVALPETIAERFRLYEVRD